MLNSEWQSSNMRCLTEFMEYNTCSDHSPVMVSLLSQAPLKAKPFRFLNMWMSHPDFHIVLREAWHIPIL